MFERYIETAIDIMAPPERVWAILTDFAAYPSWNPYIVSAYGKPAAGAWLEVHIQRRGRRTMMFRPTVLVADVNRELRWRGRLLMPGMFGGEHFFRIEDRSGTVHFVHGQAFSGLLVGLIRGPLSTTRAGFEAMNLALKERAERSGA